MKSDNKLAVISITAGFTVIILLLVLILLRTYGLFPSAQRETASTSMSSSTLTSTQLIQETTQVSSTESNTSIRLLHQVSSAGETSKYDYDKVSRTMYISDSLLDYLLNDNAINDAFNAYMDTITQTSYSDYIDYFPYFLPFNKHVTDGTIRRFVDGDYITTINLNSRGEIELVECNYQGAGYATITYEYTDNSITIKDSLSGDSHIIDRKPNYSYVDSSFDTSGRITVLQFESPGGYVTEQYSYDQHGDLESIKYVSDYYSSTTTFEYKEY